MANITILDIKPAGVELFADSESYLIDLSENELEVYGGMVWSYWINQGSGFGVPRKLTSLSGSSYCYHQTNYRG
ncbi:hypothetical protein BJP34_13170 [Moorena producens PAL-8-15-08-1]|uniref:Uncharacterized protein n=1 Tax=Moorena producens PAL-8-15-08-1 TaxID=1458985 RepID=A0A1D8TRL9_9CYAN|nr:hypothetical protein [Moorena producens]AOX00279.1 hypothetical protein BJP34_13170 [Moorena producens PAL-8-15-08-1]